MTAGRGIVHCEMPHGEGEVHGLQLWVNLAQKYKMIEPAYQELLDKDIPRTTKDGVTVKVIAGEAFGIKVCTGLSVMWKAKCKNCWCFMFFFKV